MTKTVLITGCSSGFGHSAALYFVEQGWNVVATMRNPQDAGTLGNHERIFVTRLDVEDKGSIAAAVAAGIERFGAIDVLVNNAGFGLFGVFETTPEDKIQKQFAVNVFGVMDVTRAVLPHMRARRSGVIVNVSSGAGVFTLPAISLYSASKFALEGFSEALSYELMGLGIVVKILEPGGVISTNFGARSAAELAKSQEIADYLPFEAAVQQIFAGLRGQRLATTEDVAKAIFAAATDGSEQLRYVATEDIVPLVDARRTAGEEGYLGFMRSKFLPR